MTERKNQPRATSARTSLKKKPAPRHQRENQLKEKTSSTSGPRGAQSHLTEKENLPRATSARTHTKEER
ncbi:hypothetical protein [Faecalibacterium prausnitzii]|uniref:hypothetical protein n=1 Tax=Faecalibacterium prausnitzii TaxID=853 RepID=UPI00130E6179|nr:hypothetical protein [Faecalibacterium prausnitzii]